MHATDPTEIMTQHTEGPELPNHLSSPPIIVTPGYSITHTRSDGGRSERRNPGSFVRVALVTGILLPIAVIPYLLSRRRISGLERRFEALESKLRGTEKSLRVNTLEISKLRTEHTKTRTLLCDMIQMINEVQDNAIQHAEEQGRTEEVIQSQIRKLLDEAQQIRYLDTSYLPRCLLRSSFVFTGHKP